MMEVALEHKISASLSEIAQKITERGFEIHSVKYDKKNNKYVAIAKRDDKEVKATGKDTKMAMANLLNAVAHSYIANMQALARWQHNFAGQLPEIAEAYVKAPPYEKRAAAAFMELASECRSKADAIRNKIKVETVHDATPYSSADKMHDDVRKRRKIMISDIGSNDHPLWSAQQVIDYRLCLDVLGYTAANASWDWDGTNMAFSAFAAVLSELAQQALFSELLGQTAYASYFRGYGPAKICLLNKLFDDVMEKENPYKGFRGVHPSQLLLPSEMPEAYNKFSKSKKIEADENDTLPRDINEGYSTGLEQRPSVHYPTEYDDFLNLQGAGDVLDGLHTDWAQPIHDDQDEAHVRQEWRSYQRDDPQGAHKIRMAVANAITAAFMLENSTVGHGAIKYQALYNQIHDDPHALQKILHESRNTWNTERFGDQAHDEHRPWMMYDKKGEAPLKRLAALLYDKNPQMSVTEAHNEAERMVHQMLTRFQEQVAQDSADSGKKPVDEDEWRIEREATKMLLKWLGMVTDAKGRYDHYLPHTSSASVDPIAPHKYGDDYGPENHKVFNLQRFPAVRGRSLQTIARLMKHINRIVEEALVDVHNHDGKGHHFRAYILSLEDDIKPQTVGFAWLLLAPYTSQLSMIDESMTGALGHHADDKSAREYLLHERLLMAHRDDMGLSHVPLGHFNVALKGAMPDQETKTSAMVRPKHQDLSCFRVVDPVPAWKTHLLPQNDLLYEFGLTPTAGKDIEEEWKNSVATAFAPDQIPSKKQSPKFMAISKSASKMQKYKDLGLSVQDVWDKVDEPDNFDYRGFHKAPSPEFGTPLHDISSDFFPDYYENPKLYWNGWDQQPGGSKTRAKYDRESTDAILKYRGQPDAMVPIYRAGPKGEINPGDWVTPSPSYAQQHSLHPDDPTQDMPVWTVQVPAHTLWTDGDEHNEWGYHGPRVPQADMWKESFVKEADKLHDLLMNPKNRPDLQTPEGQHFLQVLQKYHSPKTDQLMPWLTREWKKGRIADTPERAGFTPDMPIYHSLENSLLYNNPDDAVGTGWSPLDGRTLDHWADFMNSRHPIKREMGDIMQHDVNGFTNIIDDWHQALEQDASAHGQIVHTTPDNWTIRRLTQPHELTAEGNNMSHCVGSYANDVDSGKSHIYSLRDPKGAPHATIEINPVAKDVTPENAIENHFNNNLIGKALPAREKQQLRDFHDAYMKKFDPKDPHRYDTEGIPRPENWPNIGAYHENVIHNFYLHSRPEYLPNINHGMVKQIQGKGNQAPIDEYKNRIRHWFESMPYGERPRATGQLGGYGAWNDDDEIYRPDQITPAHLDPQGVNEYGLPVEINPLWDHLVKNTIDYGMRYYSDPHFNRDDAQRVYDLARIHNQIPQLAKAVGDFSDSTMDRYQTDYNDPWAWEQSSPDQSGYYDQAGNFDQERYDQDHQNAYDALVSESLNEEPEFRAMNHFYDNLKPHWNADTQQYENGTFS